MHIFHKKAPLGKFLNTVVAAVGVIALWRGVLGLMDLYIFPENQEASIWASLFIGLVALKVTHHAIRNFE